MNLNPLLSPKYLLPSQLILVLASSYSLLVRSKYLFTPHQSEAQTLIGYVVLHLQSAWHSFAVLQKPCRPRADPGFFLRRGCTRLLLYFNTNKPHRFFFFFGRIPVVLENRRSSQGVVRTNCTLPLDPPMPTEITIHLCEQKSYLVWSSCQYNSYPV